MNEQKYNDLKTNIKLAFEKDTEISKGIKKHFQNYQNILRQLFKMCYL